MADIVAANVTFTKTYEFTLGNAPDEPRGGLTPRMKMIIGTITTATNADYNDTTGIPLDNLFDSTKTSYIGLAAGSCVTVYASTYKGTGFAETSFDWANKKLICYCLNAGGGATEVMKRANITGLGTGTMQVCVIGNVIGT